nr:tryptophan 7-halogenase [Luteolibacter marinus]
MGSGSAGLLAALTLKRKIPKLEVEIVRDPDLGVIGVGEGTTPFFPHHLFDYLGIKRKRFYQMAEPTWKLGIRFLWGTRGAFDYSFSQQLDKQFAGLKMPNGFFCDDEFTDVDQPAALMRAGKAFTRLANQAPDIQGWHAFHIENHKLVETLETEARESRVKITDGKMAGAERGEAGIAAIHLADGRRLEADLFVDSSGFASELLGKALEEPFEDFGKTLFCDRAVVGGWQRGDQESIMAYTTAETMDSGWCWKIEHEHFINRGYVYCSDMISDEQAFEEFRRKNPKVPDAPRIVRFRSGFYRRSWVGNVVAIGNSAGFVEPLEATALMMVCGACRTLVDMLQQALLDPTPSCRDLFNEIKLKEWRMIRDFLGLHYQLNNADDTPFWRRCREETDLSELQGLLEYYTENGPSGFCRNRIPGTTNDFGLEGFLVMLVGNQTPYRKRYQAPAQELRVWNERRSLHANLARKGIDVKEALAFVRHPGWQWHGDS